LFKNFLLFIFMPTNGHGFGLMQARKCGYAPQAPMLFLQKALDEKAPAGRRTASPARMRRIVSADGPLRNRWFATGLDLMQVSTKLFKARF